MPHGRRAAFRGETPSKEHLVGGREGQYLDLRPSGYEFEQAHIDVCRSASEMLSELGFRGFVVSARAYG